MTQRRIAGLLYLALIVPGVFVLQYVPRALVVRGDASATAANIRASDWVLRLGIGLELLSALLFIFTVLALYDVFKGVDRYQARLMVILVLISVAVSFVNVLPETAALTLLGNADYLAPLGGPQREALALLLMRVHGQGVAVAEIFWGFWLAPLGILTYRSRFAPRIVGVLLGVAAAAYVVEALTALVAPELAQLVGFAPILEAGELSIIVWLLFSRSPGDEPDESGSDVPRVVAHA